MLHNKYKSAVASEASADIIEAAAIAAAIATEQIATLEAALQAALQPASKAKTSGLKKSTIAGLFDAALQAGGTWLQICDASVAAAEAAGLSGKINIGLIKAHYRYRLLHDGKPWAAALEVTAAGCFQKVTLEVAIEPAALEAAA